jgi:hypothetical protein
MVLFAIPMAVALSQCTGVFGWGCLKLAKVSLKMMPSWQFRKRAPGLALAADARPNFRIKHSVWIAPFSYIGLPFFGSQPRKKCPHARLWALGSDKYDAFKWMLRIMLDAQKGTVAFG